MTKPGDEEKPKTNTGDGKTQEKPPLIGTASTSATQASSLQVSGISSFNFNALNLAEEWKIWLRKYEFFELAANFQNESSQRRVAMLLHSMAGNGIEIYNSFNMDSAEQYDYKKVVTAFEKHFDSKCSITLIRHKFFTCTQKEQTIMEYVTELQNLSQVCKFNDLRSELVRDIFIAGLTNKKLQVMLLKESNLDIDKAVNMCRAVETSMEHVNKDKSEHVMKINQRGGSSSSTSRQYGCSSSKQYASKKNFNFSQKKNIKCFKCGRLGHMKSQCRSTVSAVCIDADEDISMMEDGVHDIFIGEVNQVNGSTVNDVNWTQCVHINEKEIIFKLDTGSPVNLISLKLFQEIFGKNKPRIDKKNWNLSTVSNDKIPVVGSVYLLCNLHGSDKKHRLEFIVANIDCNPLLGSKTCENLNLVTRISSIEGKYNYIFQKYSNVLSNEVGTIGPPYHIKLSDNAVPRIDGQRKIPFAMKDNLKIELERMEKLGIIERVTEPTEWVNSIVIVKKSNGKLRICLDPRYLNKFIVTSSSSIPTFEQIVSNLTGAKYFSVLDCNSGFWQIPLDSESSKLCTFNSPLGGRYLFKKLPFGLSCSSEAFQERINFIFENQPGVALYIDDVIVWGNSVEEHDQRLQNVLEIASRSGLKFNKDKCKLGLQEIKFLGHIFSDQSITIDKDKISAVLKMTSPTCKKDLERIIGFFNYLSRFIPNFSEITAPLRELMKKSNEFVWTNEHSQAFCKLKEIVTSSPVLKIFDPHKDVILSVDSSIEGCGAVLLQEDAPVAFASKALSPTQKKSWAQIEREMYAIVFGCVKFHQYIFGKKVLVETDHKALESLFNKPLNSVPARVQRMMLKIQCYNLVVKYKPGKLLYLADTLSRASLPNQDNELLVDLDNDIVCHVNSVIDCLPVSQTKLDEIKRESENDAVHKLLRHVIFHGWPNDKNKLYNELKVFWTYKEDLNVVDSLIFKNNSLLIPKSLQKEMLNKIHEGHMGMNFCCNRAKNVIFWPNMYNQIKDICSKCDTCITYSCNNSKEELINHDIPNLPWIKLGCDFFEFNKTQYLIVVDYFSKFFEIAKLDNLTAQHVITHFKSIFARHGIPKLIICDSGSQFTSQMFKDFSILYEFDFVCSSPYHHKSNGLAEAHVKIVKNILKKCHHDGTDPYLSILNFRNTGKNNSPSPASLLFSRNLRTKIPCHENNLKPKVFENNNIHSNYKLRNYYNKSAHNLKPVNVGDNIYFKRDVTKPWVKGRVFSKTNQPRSYIVEDEKNCKYRRNRVHLKIVPKHNFEGVSAASTPFCTPEKLTTPKTSSPESPLVKTPQNSQYVIPVIPQTLTTRFGRAVKPVVLFDQFKDQARK